MYRKGREISSIPIKVDLLGIDWKYCYSSDLPRSLQTAKCIYQGEIIEKAELREIPIPQFGRS